MSHLYLISLTLNTTPSFFFPCSFLSPPSPRPCLLFPPPLLFSSPPLFLSSSFYLPPLLALSWRPVVKCKHDWAPEPEGFDSYQLFLCSHPPVTPLLLIPPRFTHFTSQNEKSAGGKGDNCLYETNSRKKSKTGPEIFQRKSRSLQFTKLKPLLWIWAGLPEIPQKSQHGCAFQRLFRHLY